MKVEQEIICGRHTRLIELVSKAWAYIKIRIKFRGKIKSFGNSAFYKPIMLFISKKASFIVRDSFDFNLQLNEIRQKRNKTPGSFFLDDESEVMIDSFACYAGCRITVHKHGKLILHGGYMSLESVIECYKYIEIGEGCTISERVLIRDSNNHIISRDGYEISKPIIIGKHVWIGMGAMILSGVTIGDGAIIAAGAVVNKDIPDHCLAGGVPAKVLRENIEWN